MWFRALAMRVSIVLGFEHVEALGWGSLVRLGCGAGVGVESVEKGDEGKGGKKSVWRRVYM
jgi:hypothetical protein